MITTLFTFSILSVLLMLLIPVLILVWILRVIVKHGREQRRLREDELNGQGNPSDNNQFNEIKMSRKLRRSHTDRMIGGVCGGLAEYFDVDPTIVRVGYVLLTLFTAFSGLLVYIILLVLIPRE